MSTSVDIYLLGFSVMEMLAGNRLNEFFIDPVLERVDWEVAKLDIEDKAEAILNNIPDVDEKMTGEIRQMIHKYAKTRPRRAGRILKELKSPYTQPITGPIYACPLILKSEQNAFIKPPVLINHANGNTSDETVLGGTRSLLHDDEAAPVLWSEILRQRLKKPYIAWPATALLFVCILAIAAYLFGPVKFRFDPVYDVVGLSLKKNGMTKYRPMKSDTEGYYRLEPGTYDFSIQSGGLTLVEKRLTLTRSKKLFEGDKEFNLETLTVPVFFDLKTDTFSIFVNGHKIEWKRKKVCFFEGTYEIIAVSGSKMSDLVRFTVNTSTDLMHLETPQAVVDTPKDQNDHGATNGDEKMVESTIKDEGQEAANANVPPARRSGEEKNVILLHNFRWSLPREGVNESVEETVANFLAGLYSLAIPSWDRFLPKQREKFFDRFCQQVCVPALQSDEVRVLLQDMKKEIYASIMQVVGSLIDENSSDMVTWSELSDRTLAYWQNFEEEDFRFHYYNGFLFLKLEKWDDANDSLSLAISGGMQGVLLYELRCTAREKLWKWDKALEDIETAMKIAPKRRDEFLLRQATLFVLRGEWEKKQRLDANASFRDALDILNRLAENRPDDSDIGKWQTRARENLGPEEKKSSTPATEEIQGDKR